MKAFRWCAGFAAVCWLAAQTPAPPAAPKLQNKGKPMALSFQCTAEHFKDVDLPCTPEAPCPVFLELSAAAGAATKLFVTGNFHTSSNTLSSLLLMSEDEGQSWTEPWARQPGIGLEHIQFFDFATGWISGGSLGVPPKDPFLLLTTDGGATWRKRPISAESRPGSIEQFRFDNAREGILLIDRIRASEEGHRYELHQTMTGGESWSLQQVSRQPLKLPNAREERPGAWRVRADAPTKSYVVEQSEGPRWKPIASFLIAAGHCQPPVE